ncbi:hypothetical protein KCG48_05090 [Proteiniclasticum sp. BAD-10]|uniref:Uncharacterized protein n=1 Tax=Proteiniclasticum sediminis TaxID=2804028 RepID=A0A941CN28_9CLOT|nr:hypothetical protein [Proteiniclasticum sediminis]MBR0575716.1 hypothetical protein [Proteiniclasticum sediminis]
MNVILTCRETGYKTTGGLLYKTSDNYVVRMDNGTDALFPMRDWECEEVQE